MTAEAGAAQQEVLLPTGGGSHIPPQLGRGCERRQSVSALSQ
jgi:hypothetical protein